jgi:hypothetical protein
MGAEKEYTRNAGQLLVSRVTGKVAYSTGFANYGITGGVWASKI